MSNNSNHPQQNPNFQPFSPQLFASQFGQPFPSQYFPYMPQQQQQQQFPPNFPQFPLQYPQQTQLTYNQFYNQPIPQIPIRSNSTPSSIENIMNQNNLELGKQDENKIDIVEDEKSLQILALKNRINELQQENQQLKQENSDLRQENNKFKGKMQPQLKQQYVESQIISNSSFFNQSLNLQLPQIQCQYADHKESQVKFICINEKCEKCRLLCKYCWRQKNHVQHYQDLRELEEYYTQFIDDIQKYDYLLKLFGQVYEKIKKVKELLENFAPASLTEQQQMTSTQIGDQINKYIKIRKLNKFFKAYHLNKVDEFYNFIRKIDEKSILNQSLSSQKILFSKILRHQQCNISANGNVAILHGQQGFLICEPALNINCFNLITIKIIECGNIYLGIGDLNILQKVEYNPNLQQLGHGTFIIDEQGFVYSHNENDANYVQKSFQFQKNDEISIEVNEFDQNIKWTKKQTQEQFTMKYKLEGALYFLIGLNGASVEIIYEI